MREGVQPYPSYRTGGVRWLKAIPKHWEVRRNGRLFSQRKEAGFPDLPVLEVSLRTGVRIRDLENAKRKQMMFDRGKYQRAVAGDIAYNMMRMWQGAAGVAPADGLVSPAYVVARPHESVDPEYYSYLFRTAAYKGEVVTFSRGIVPDRNRIYWQDFKRILSLYPPLDEQRQIVAFIRYKDQQVRRFIRAKRGLIELLNEQKRAIIHQAVTWGLNENASLRPSGLFWLPQIPDHWPIEPIKRQLGCLNHMRVPLSASARGSMREQSFPYYGASGIIDHVEDYIFDDDLLLIAEDGANLVLRNLPLAITAHGKFWVNNHAHILKPKNGSLAYFALILEMIDYRPWISGAAQPKLTQDCLLSLPIPVPPLSEQEAIVSFLQDTLRPQEAAIDRARREISLINEYRDRLVADLVTGQLDVRRVAVPAIEDAVDALPYDYLAQPEESLEFDHEDMVAVG